jgi:hypothetical protein
MTTKSLLLTGALALCSFSMGFAKSYDLVFSTPVRAGNLQLEPGEYTLKVKGNVASFTNIDTEKTYTAPVKIQNTGKKHDVTAVDTTNNQIQKIELGGSADELQFGE